MIHPICACLLGCIFVCGRIIQTQASCSHPDVPANGNYVPKQRKFEPGDEILYSCQKGFALWGEERRVCKSNGLWSDDSPFCDYAVKLENASVRGENFALPHVQYVIDGNNKTCFEWANQAEHIYVNLVKKTVIRTLKLYLKNEEELVLGGDPVDIQILTGLNNDLTLCGDHRSLPGTDQWITIKCRNNVLSDTIKILFTGDGFLTICEMDAYGKAEDGCDYPPSRKVPNGHFEVSRSRAVLICNEGYRSENRNGLVCEGNSWVGDRLKCEAVDPGMSSVGSVLDPTAAA